MDANGIDVIGPDKDTSHSSHYSA